MLNRLGYILAGLVVVAIALACLAWTALEPPTLPVPRRDGVTVIKDVTLVNPGLGRSAHVDITIRGGVIASIRPASALTSRNDVRCAGCYALPGLIDMRGAVQGRLPGDERRAALTYLVAGVTSVRPADSERVVESMRLAISTGRYPGPRLLPCPGRGGRCADLDLPRAPLDDKATATFVQASLTRQAAYTPRLVSGAQDPRRPVLVRALFRAGVPVYAAGGDAWTLLRELKAIADLGAGPEGALVTATTSPGRFWPEATYGQVAIGLPADIVLYRADPSVDLATLGRPQIVVADGRVYSGDQLRAWAKRYERQRQAIGGVAGR